VGKDKVLAASFTDDARIAAIFLDVFAKKIVKKMVGEKIDKAHKERAETLIGVFGGTSKFVVGILTLLMILPEFGVNIGALLAGVGLLGLAVGMASRDIISDFLSGIFIILEDQFHVGDRVKIAGVEGEVIEMTLRRTVIKDGDNMLHLIPNGQIKTVGKIESR